MYTKILVPVDGSPTSTLGLAEAIKLAKLTGAQLKLIHAVDMMSVSLTPEVSMAATPTVFELLRQGGQAILTRAKAEADKSGISVETVLVETLNGRVCDLVVDEAKQWVAELIVIGTHGRRGVGRMLMGSDAEQILRLSPVPVLLVRAKEA
jgi:nucleotide-binding universal stress UspA family protein